MIDKPASIFSDRGRITDNLELPNTAHLAFPQEILIKTLAGAEEMKGMLNSLFNRHF